MELLSYQMIDVDMKEAEILETKVLYWRRRVKGERSHLVLETVKILAFVKTNIKGKELEGMGMQQDMSSSWAQILWATDRLAWMQEKTDQLDKAIETPGQLLARMNHLLACQQGLALLGNHAGNVKLVGRNQEAEALRADILQRVPLILKPLPDTDNGSIRGVACAFRINGEFDEEATALYLKKYRLKQRLCGELGELHSRTALVSRFLHILYNEGHLVQPSIRFLGIEHATTKLAMVQFKSRLSSLDRDDVRV
ncbi:MAG: hypothetical protein Q9188_007380 [Gyalolechia gomerana]